VGTSSAPVFPFPGGTAGAEAPDPELGKPGHFAWSRWIKQFVKNLDRETVKRSGDTMTGTLTLVGPQGANNTAATISNIESYQRPFPIGAVIQYAGTTAPTDWHLCDGSAHGSPALAAILAGTPNPNATPDLRGRFVVGAGGAYARGATGGAELVTLSVNQSGLRHHNHWADPPSTGTNEAGSYHDHGASGWTGGGGGHGHNHYASNMLTAEGDFNPAGSGYKYLSGTGATIGGDGSGHDHPVGVSVAASNPIHSHSVDIGGFATNHEGNWNAAEAHENRPPYYALVYIIKKA
jgi:hypothetical protein